MSRNLTTKAQSSASAHSRSKKETREILCDGCCQPIEAQYDLLTIMHGLVLVRCYCSRCYARMTLDIDRRAPHATGSRGRRYRSTPNTPLGFILRAISHAIAHRSAAFPGSRIFQINNARMTILLVLAGVLALASSLSILLDIEGAWKFLLFFWPPFLWLLELRLVSYFRYERHVQ